jgi:hypothetical protein
MNNLFTVSTAEQPIAGKPELTQAPYVREACFSEARNTLYIWMRSAFERAIDHLDIFEGIDDLAPPQPFDPRARDAREPFLWASFRFVVCYEPLTGWQTREGGGLDICVG